MDKFFIIFNHQLKIFYNNPKNFFSNILFYICFLAIFLIIFNPLQANLLNSQDQYSNYQKLLISASFFSILTCLFTSINDFLQEDFNDGTIEQIIISCENLEIFIIAKMLANWFNNCFSSVILSVAIGIFFGYDFTFLWHFFLLFLLTSLVINCICSFCGAISIAGGSSSLISFIALPLIIPIILFGCLGIYENFIENFKILIALNLFLNPILAIACASIVKISIE